MVHWPPEQSQRSVGGWGCADCQLPRQIQLNWLSIRARISFKINRLMFNIHSHFYPVYMSSLVTLCSESHSRWNLRSADKGNFVVPRSKLKFGNRCLSLWLEKQTLLNCSWKAFKNYCDLICSRELYNYIGHQYIQCRPFFLVFLVFSSWYNISIDVVRYGVDSKARVPLKTDQSVFKARRKTPKSEYRNCFSTTKHEARSEKQSAKPKCEWWLDTDYQVI